MWLISLHKEIHLPAEQALFAFNYRVHRGNDDVVMCRFRKIRKRARAVWCHDPFLPQSFHCFWLSLLCCFTLTACLNFCVSRYLWQRLMRRSVGCWEAAVVSVSALLWPEMSVWHTASPRERVTFTWPHTRTVLVNVQMTAVTMQCVGVGKGWICVYMFMCVP